MCVAINMADPVLLMRWFWRQFVLLITANQCYFKLLLFTDRTIILDSCEIVQCKIYRKICHTVRYRQWRLCCTQCMVSSVKALLHTMHGIVSEGSVTHNAWYRQWRLCYTQCMVSSVKALLHTMHGIVSEGSVTYNARYHQWRLCYTQCTVSSVKALLNLFIITNQ